MFDGGQGLLFLSGIGQVDDGTVKVAALDELNGGLPVDGGKGHIHDDHVPTVGVKGGPQSLQRVLHAPDDLVAACVHQADQCFGEFVGGNQEKAPQTLGHGISPNGNRNEAIR